MWNQAPPVYYDDPDEVYRRGLAMVPEQKDQAAEVPDSSTQSVTPTLSPAQIKYKAALERVPNMGDYKPSKWRRFGAALAGGFVGAGHGPRAGMEIAKELTDAPWNQALSSWQRETEAAGLGAGIEERAMTQDIARRRALAYEQSSATSAAARTAAAEAAQRRAQAIEAQNNWLRSPEYQDRQIALRKASLAPGYADPAYVEGRIKVHGPPVPESEKQAGRMAIEGERTKRAYGVANIGAGARVKAAGMRGSKGPSPRDQFIARALAADTVARSNPLYKNFMVIDEDSGKPRMATPQEVDALGSGFFGGPKPEIQDQNRAAYKKFLQDVAREEQRILQLSSGVAAGEDEENEDDDPADILDEEDMEEEEDQ